MVKFAGVQFVDVNIDAAKLCCATNMEVLCK